MEKRKEDEFKLKQAELEMKERTLPDNYVVFSGTVNVPKTILHKRLFYNYIMVHGKGITDTFEYVYCGTLSGSSINRCLNIKNSDLVKEFIGIDDYKKVLFKDAELSGKSFKPAWQLTSYSSDGINGEELINHISLVVDGLKEVYCRHASLWYPLDFHKVVGSVILHPDIIVLLKILNTRENITNEEQVLHMVTAITISYLVSEYQIVLDDSARSMLCESLLPKPDNEKKLSCDFDTVSAFFPTTKKQVTESVLTLSRQIASKTSNPCWTYCLPILHFLQGKCAPFQQASAAVNHGDTKPEWWGISEYIYDIEYFKAKTLPWDSTFADAWRSCRISGDVLQETLKYMMNRDFAVFAIEAFVVSLDMYDKVQEKVDWKSKEIKDIKVSQDSHMKMFERMRFDICKYLSNQTFYTKELAYLERWNAALRIKAPKGNIKDSYMKYVEEQLKMELQKVSASQALIKIYLIQNEQFESTIQAMLSEIAFKAIHEFDFDMEIMREDRVVMRMGDLINSVLERSWKTRDHRPTSNFRACSNTTVMEDLIRKLDDLGTFPINRLVRTLQFDEITDIERHRPFVKVFELSQDQLDILPDIVECSRGLLFTKLWEDQGIELKKELNRKLTIHEVLTEVWEPTVNQWKTICQRLKRGDLFFSEFERFFRNTEIGNLRDELTLLERGGNTRWVDERLDQVEKYRNLKSCEFGAEAILEVVKAFDLQGDFNQIITICKFCVS
ncbi:unnamed protein product [Mytilus edulis]|uniref:Uncharacterized protein n=1 Tax=Mytilus edulis TaxID=6550 RepID=A0A8S3U7Z2_MYTED|nr:unnamed protein product [Mytilus edulis]